MTTFQVPCKNILILWENIHKLGWQYLHIFYFKRKYKIETEVENWISKYDQDMGEKQDEYEQIDEVYTKEKKQLRYKHML